MGEARGRAFDVCRAADDLSAGLSCNFTRPSVNFTLLFSFRLNIGL